MFIINVNRRSHYLNIPLFSLITSLLYLSRDLTNVITFQFQMQSFHRSYWTEEERLKHISPSQS